MFSVCQMPCLKVRVAAFTLSQLNLSRMAAHQSSSLASVRNVFTIDAHQHNLVDVFKVFLTDLSAEETFTMKINDQSHLSPGKRVEMLSVLQETTFGENARALVQVCVLPPFNGSSSTTNLFVNIIMSVHAGSLHVFFMEKTWEALGIHIEDFLDEQALVVIM